MNDVYTPPSADLNAPPIRRTQGEVSHNVVESLKSTRPWVLLIAVLGFLLSGLLVLFSLILMVTGGIMGADMGLGPGAGIAIGLMYMAMSLVYIIPCLYLIRYARNIKALGVSRSIEDLEKSLQSQKSFWKTVGLIVLAMIGLYVLLIVMMVVVGVVGSAVS